MMTFEELWEQEERQGVLSRLQGEYPGWQRRRNRRHTVAAVAAVAVVAVFAFHLPPFTSHSYDYVCCNRSGIAEGHWAEVASNILTIETL